MSHTSKSQRRINSAYRLRPTAYTAYSLPPPGTQAARRTASRRRTGFTLAELLMAISILAILGALSLALIRGARYDANAARTETQIRRIEQFLNEHLEEYFVRVLPYRLKWLKPDSGTPATDANYNQRTALRSRMLIEYIRSEMPCLQIHVSDTFSGPYPPAANFVSNHFQTDFGIYWYDRNGNTTFDAGEQLVDDIQNHPTPLVTRMARKLVRDPAAPPPAVPWSPEFEGAECLYEILNSYNDAYSSGLDALFDNEIGDTDLDGRREVLDAWGDPLVFVVTVEDLPGGPPLSYLPVRPIDGPYVASPGADDELKRRLNEDGPAAVRLYIRSINRLDR